jgi:hypothetical protein
MLKVRPAREIIVRMPNAIGSLDRMMKTISEHGINIIAASAWVEGGDAQIHLVTEDNLRVMDALRTHHYKAREAEVLVADAPHTPGMLHHICEKLAQDEIDIHHLYATTAVSADRALIVFASANNDRAMVLLNA